MPSLLVWQSEVDFFVTMLAPLLSMRAPMSGAGFGGVGAEAPIPVSMGTSIVAVSYGSGESSGVILGADSRTSTGSYIANRRGTLLPMHTEWDGECLGNFGSKRKVISNKAQRS